MRFLLCLFLTVLLLRPSGVVAFDATKPPAITARELQTSTLQVQRSGSRLFGPVKVPVFDEARGVLLRGLIFDSGGSVDTPGAIRIPPGKQLDVLGWRETDIAQGANTRLSWLDFDLVVSGAAASSNTYGVIGALSNKGSGVVSAIYGRAGIAENAAPGGVAIAYKGGVTTRQGAGVSAGFQMSVDSIGLDGAGKLKPVEYGFWLQTNNYSGLGYVPLKYGLLADRTVQTQEAFVQGYAGGPGDALRWLSADGMSVLARIDRDGAADLRGLSIRGGGIALRDLSGDKMAFAVTSAGRISASGIQSRSGTNGLANATFWNLNWVGSALEAWADTTKVGNVALVVAAPRSSSSACTAGTRAFDGRYVYTCVDTNTWRRKAVADEGSAF